MPKCLDNFQKKSFAKVPIMLDPVKINFSAIFRVSFSFYKTFGMLTMTFKTFNNNAQEDDDIFSEKNIFIESCKLASDVRFTK